MRRDNSPWQAVTPAALEWDDKAGPVSLMFGDVYYSRDNGLLESEYVFLQGNGLPQRWSQHFSQHFSQHRRKHFCIGESGFGTGLNFLLTWRAWRAAAEPRPDLHYLSVEKYPLSAADLRRALANWPELAPLAEQLLQHYPGLLPGQHRLLLDEGRVRLDLWWEDIAQALPDLASSGQALVDAWYLDGFAPARNEAMWSTQVLTAVTALSRPQASFATFTAAGQVRRDLLAAGFEVHKVPGFGRKRECLRGTLLSGSAASGAATEATLPTADTTPWDLDHSAATAVENVIVVGGGLAGCTVAAALARRGVRVTLLEKGKLADAGSGNEQGILYTRLSRKHSALTDFSLQSFRFAASFYRGMFNAGVLEEGLDGALCGSFHQSDKHAEMADLAQVLTQLPELAQVMDAQQAQQVLGVNQPSAGYWFPQSGWMRPVSVCHALAATGGIDVRQDCGAISLLYSGEHWHARANGQDIANASCVVVATGTDTNALEQLDWLPLQAIRGQTTELPTSAGLASLRGALCHKGYIAPARGQRHCIGASFDLQDDEAAPRSQDHRHNLDQLAAAVPHWHAELQALDPASLEGRVGFRCASPDYLPMVGRVPDRQAFLHNYAPLRKNARQTISRKGEYIPGLYLSTAHGSRGLTSTPLAAELLASTICAQPPPLSRELCRALAPARFIMRDLARNRT